MQDERPSSPPKASPAQLVGRAIQDLAAARLGRGFIPLAALFLLGVGQILMRSGGLDLAVGAPVCAGAMLAYGLRVVQHAFGRPARPWMTLALIGGIVPPTFGVWVFGWLGLRGVAVGGGVRASLGALLMVVLGAWVLRAWVQLVELQRLAGTMAAGLPGGEDGA